MKREDQILIELLADFVNGQSPGASGGFAEYGRSLERIQYLLHQFLENAEEPAVRKLQESHMANVPRYCWKKR